MFAIATGDVSSFLIATLLYIAPGLAISLFLTSKPGHLARALPITIFVHFTFYEYAHFISIRQSNVVSIAFIIASAVYLLRFVSRQSFISGIKTLNTHLMSVVSGMTLAFIWARNAKSFGSIIPNHDAMNHSYMIKNIVETGSQQFEQATRLFPIGSGHAGSFYPLGEHSLIASAVRLTHSSISGQMNVMAIFLSICVLPYALTVLCEQVFPGKKLTVRIAAPIASLLLISTFPFAPLSWGGMGVIVAMAYVPGAATAFVNAVEEKTKKSTLLSAMLFVGLFVMHNTEAITAFLLALLILLYLSGLTQLKSVFIESLKIGLFALAVLWPLIPSLIGGAADRGLDYQGQLDPAGTLVDFALRFFVGVPQYALLLLIAVSLVAIPRRVSSTFGLAYIALGALCVTAGRWPQNSLVRTVFKPWYGQVLRMNYNIVYIAVPILVALVLATIGNSNFAWMKKSAVAFPVVLLFVLSMRTSITTANAELHQWYRDLVPNTSHSLAAYRYMASHARDIPMAMTESDTTSNSTWMYAIAGVRPINATAMTGPGNDRYSAIKSELLKNVGRLKNHPAVLAWVKAQKVQYFYFDENVNLITPNHDTSLDALRSDSELREVFSSGNAHVFEFRVSAN
jgi:hypothetical protein